MKIFLDTSVLVASCVQSHPQYAQAWPVVKRVVAGKDTGFISSHSIAEVYAVLTRLPLQPRIHSSEAARLVQENFLDHFSTVLLAKDDYTEAIKEMAQAGWIGGKIYDALILRCAEKSGADRIYTFNLNDFRQIAPASLRNRVCTP